jgi:hypothetical protein
MREKGMGQVEVPAAQSSIPAGVRVSTRSRRVGEPK